MSNDTKLANQEMYARKLGAAAKSMATKIKKQGGAFSRYGTQCLPSAAHRALCYALAAQGKLREGDLQIDRDSELALLADRAGLPATAAGLHEMNSPNRYTDSWTPYDDNCVLFLAAEEAIAKGDEAARAARRRTKALAAAEGPCRDVSGA